MGYSDLINRTGASALIPEEYSNAVLDQVTESSAVMKLAKQLSPMSRKQHRLPVLDSLPTASFMNAENSLIETTNVTWDNVYIDAEKLAVEVPIPMDVLDDTDIDIWAYVKPLLVEALGKTIDQAVLYGTGIPTTWTNNLGGAGLVARCTTASHTVSIASFTDLYEAIMGESSDGAADGLLAKIEADGFMATGHVAAVAMRGRIRNCRDMDGLPIFKSGPTITGKFATGELDGGEVLYPLNGSMVPGTALMISGDWSKLVYKMRKDITYRIRTDGVIQDTGGNITHNLGQQDMVSLQAIMRLGFALPNPINQMNGTAATRCQFAALTA